MHSHSFELTAVQSKAIVADQFSFWLGAAGAGDGGVSIGPNGKIFVADTWNHRIQIFDSGFGNRKNTAVDWFAEFDCVFYAGIWNDNAGSGRVWQMQRQVFLPMIIK